MRARRWGASLRARRRGKLERVRWQTTARRGLRALPALWANPRLPRARSVLECASPLALFSRRGQPSQMFASQRLTILRCFFKVNQSAGESGGGPPHSKTLARRLWLPRARSVLECASLLALFHGVVGLLRRNNFSSTNY